MWDIIRLLYIICNVTFYMHFILLYSVGGTDLNLLVVDFKVKDFFIACKKTNSSGPEGTETLKLVLNIMH